MININSLYNRGNNGIFIQLINSKGEKIEETLEKLLSPYIKPYDDRIDELKNNLEDKKKIVDLLDKEVIELSGKIELLEEEKKILEEQVTVILNTLNGKDLSKTNKLYEQAYKYFIDGDIDQALEVLDEAKLEEEEKSVSETRILKARLLSIKNEFDEAGKNYERAVKLCTDWNSALEAANFFRIFDDNKAEHYCQISLTEANTDYKKIISLNILALIHKANNNFNDADELLNEAFQLSEKLGKTQSEADLSYYSMVLHNIGNQWFDKNELSKAEECYKIVLKIRKQLAENNLNEYTYQVAETTNNLGLVKRHQEDYKNAKIYLQEAEEIIEGLAKTVSKNYYLKLAETQRNIALLESKNQKKTKEEAEELYLNALDSFYKLPKPIQEINEAKAFIARFYNSLGLLQKKNEELSKANTSFQNSLNVSRDLAEQNPSKYLPVVTTALHNIGNNFAKKGDYTKAEKHFKEALNILKEFAALVPEKFEITLAKTYMCLGDLYSFDQLNNEQLFQKYIYKSIELYEKYADKVPEAKKWRDIAKKILSEWKKEWLENFDKVIDETFDEYDEVFKALA